MPCTKQSCEKSGKKAIMPPTYFLVLLLASLPTYFIFRVIAFPFNLAGCFFIAFGIAMNLWSDSKFKQRETTVSPFGRPTTLVAEGPFRISRNPMYVGMASILLGVAMLVGSLIAFACPAIFVVVIQAKFLPVEEKNLEDTFGNKYVDYKKSVRQWI